MSTASTPPATKSKKPDEIRIIAHSSLFYWWPVWAFGFLFAAWTAIEDSRMSVVPSGTTVTRDGNVGYTATFPKKYDPAKDPTDPQKQAQQALADGAFKEFVPVAGKEGYLEPKLRCTSHVALGTLYMLILVLVIFITNVPLRGLWSIVTIILLVMLALIFALLGWWDDIFRKAGNLHVYINLGGYLFVSTVLFVIWFVAVNFFDKRTYVVFGKGQIRVCEEIGGREKTYDTIGMTIEKHRDDLFRHWVLGGGSGDLTIKTSGADHQQILMPNVLGIGWRLPKIEAMLRERSTGGTVPPSM